MFNIGNRVEIKLAGGASLKLKGIITNLSGKLITVKLDFDNEEYFFNKNELISINNKRQTNLPEWF